MRRSQAVDDAPERKSRSARLCKLESAKDAEFERLRGLKQGLYADWKEGAITREEFDDMGASFGRKIEAAQTALEKLRAEQTELANGVDAESPALTAFKKRKNIEALDREILAEFVDHIKVYEGGKSLVSFKFSDEFRRVLEFIEINGGLQKLAG
jgi:hypothetical protein